MTPVYALATNIISPLGLSTSSVWQSVIAGRTGIKEHTDASFSQIPFFASKLNTAQIQNIQSQVSSKELLSPFEQMAVYSAQQALNDISEIDPSQAVLILSTTKGNIEWLDNMPDHRILLHTSAAIIAKHLGINSTPIVISQACVSGVVALQYGLRLLQKGRYKHAIVIGCDRFSRFVLNGFQSFHAIANGPCKPFDRDRKGINLGEAAATIILSTQTDESPIACLVAGATSNDANHISGPSRTGEELSFAITKALEEAAISSSQIDMLSAHGTATVYNDEMEAKAFGLSGLAETPMHSMKGYIGHTLGAAGLLESVMVIEALQRQQLIPTINYTNNGVSVPLNVTTETKPAKLHYVLKTASGFGGSNAAVVWSKV
jgi:3-oxoacyl-[acyl-carrier-protein] synthase-1